MDQPHVPQDARCQIYFRLFRPPSYIDSSHTRGRPDYSSDQLAILAPVLPFTTTKAFSVRLLTRCHSIRPATVQHWLPFVSRKGEVSQMAVFRGLSQKVEPIFLIVRPESTEELSINTVTLLPPYNVRAHPQCEYGSPCH